MTQNLSPKTTQSELERKGTTASRYQTTKLTVDPTPIYDKQGYGCTVHRGIPEMGCTQCAAVRMDDYDISAAEFNNYQRLFRTFDEDSSATIDSNELRKVLQYVGVHIDEDETKTLVDQLDRDGSGELTFDEFLILMVKHKELHKYKIGERSAVRTTADRLKKAIDGKSRPFLFRPDDPWKWAWDTILLGAVFYYVFCILIMDCNFIYNFGASLSPSFWGLEILFSIIFAMDVLFQFRMAFADGMSIELNPTVILRKYLSGRFAFDFVAALPLDLIARGLELNEPALLFYHIRLLKVFRVPELFSITSPALISPNYTRFHFSLVPFMRQGFYTLSGLHLLCVIRLILLKSSWGSEEVVSVDSYVGAIYYVLYTVTGVGYGDIIVSTVQERLFACLLFVIGTIAQGLIIGHITHVMSQADITGDRHTAMRQTLAVLQQFEIPISLQEEILGFQLHVLECNFTSTYANILQQLPLAMQDKLNLYMRLKFISVVPMFQSASKECNIALAQELYNVVVPPEEFIICVGEKANEMYFLGYGFADVIARGGKLVATLQKGSFFGEAALLHQNARRNSTIKALTFCDLYVLKKASFVSILNRFPKFREAIQRESAVQQPEQPLSPLWAKKRNDEKPNDKPDKPELRESGKPRERARTRDSNDIVSCSHNPVSIVNSDEEADFPDTSSDGPNDNKSTTSGFSFANGGWMPQTRPHDHHPKYPPPRGSVASMGGFGIPGTGIIGGAGKVVGRSHRVRGESQYSQSSHRPPAGRRGSNNSAFSAASIRSNRVKKSTSTKVQPEKDTEQSELELSKDEDGNLIGQLKVKISRGQGLKPKDIGGTSDPFVKLTLDKETRSTTTKMATLDPVWNETFVFACKVQQPFPIPAGQTGPVFVASHELELEVFDRDFIGKETMGRSKANLSNLKKGIPHLMTCTLEEGAILITVEAVNFGHPVDDEIVEYWSIINPLDEPPEHPDASPMNPFARAAVTEIDMMGQRMDKVEGTLTELASAIHSGFKDLADQLAPTESQATLGTTESDILESRKPSCPTFEQLVRVTATMGSLRSIQNQVRPLSPPSGGGVGPSTRTGSPYPSKPATGGISPRANRPPLGLDGKSQKISTIVSPL